MSNVNQDTTKVYHEGREKRIESNYDKYEPWQYYVAKWVDSKGRLQKRKKNQA